MSDDPIEPTNHTPEAAWWMDQDNLECVYHYDSVDAPARESAWMSHSAFDRVFQYDSVGDRVDALSCESDAMAQDELDHVFRYDSAGNGVEAPGLEADTPVFLLQDGLPAPKALNPIRESVSYDGGARDRAGSWRQEYAWTGRQLDVDIALQYNRVKGPPDTTPGRFLEEAE